MHFIPYPLSLILYAMFGDDILVRTLLLPPRLPRRWLARERLDRLLSSVVEYPVTVVSASAGSDTIPQFSRVLAESCALRGTR